MWIFVIAVIGIFVVSKISRTRSNIEGHRSLIDEMNRQQHQQFVDWSMEEGRKSVTPFEHGGYDITQGNSFNNDHHMHHNNNNFNNGF